MVLSGICLQQPVDCSTTHICMQWQLSREMVSIHLRDTCCWPVCPGRQNQRRAPHGKGMTDGLKASENLAARPGIAVPGRGWLHTFNQEHLSLSGKIFLVTDIYGKGVGLWSSIPPFNLLPLTSGPTWVVKKEQRGKMENSWFLSSKP